MTDEELDAIDEQEQEVDVLEDSDAERIFREVFTGVEEDSAAGGEFLTIGLEYLKFEDDVYSSKKESQKVIDEIAESIGKVGLLQPPVVVRSEHGYTVVAGRKRIKACQKLNLKEVTCVVRELDDLQQKQATLIENLCRVVYDGPARDKARAELHKLYLILHPETKHGIAGGLARANPDQERAPSFSKVMSEKEGISESSIQTSIVRGNTFSDMDRSTFLEYDIPQVWQTKLSRVSDDDERNEILNLVRKGVPYQAAGKKVCPEIFEGPKEDKKERPFKLKEKPREPVASTDQEWLASFESVRLQVNTELFDLHAVLYRRILDVLEDTRSVLRKYEHSNNLKGNSGTISHLPAIVGRFLKTPHPQEWQICGSCNGKGSVELKESDNKESDKAKCPHCGNTGFVVPPANVGYWIRFGIKGLGKKDKTE